MVTDGNMLPCAVLHRRENMMTMVNIHPWTSRSKPWLCCGSAELFWLTSQPLCVSLSVKWGWDWDLSYILVRIKEEISTQHYSRSSNTSCCRGETAESQPQTLCQGQGIGCGSLRPPPVPPGWGAGFTVREESRPVLPNRDITRAQEAI